MQPGKSTSSVGIAAKIVRQVFGPHTGSKNTIPVTLPRRDHPVYLMPTKHAQPWGLLPMKAAAYAQYPNFFNNSCNFFGCIDRDLKAGRPCSVLRATKLALDLAKALRNLGILASYAVGQKLEQLGDHDYVWQEQLEPQHFSELKLYQYKHLKVDLRWDLYKPVWGSPQQTLSQTPLDLPEPLPLSVTNVSRPSQPVYLTPGVIKQELQRYPSGIFVMYHHELGLTTDAALSLLREPGLVLAHLGLPYSHVAQIHACMKHKLRQEERQPLSQTVPLQSWSMVDFVKQHLDQRRGEVGEGASVEKQKQEIRRLVERGRKEDETLINDFDVSRVLQNELIAWQLKDKIARPQKPRDTGDEAGSSSGAGRGQAGARSQSPREGGRAAGFEGGDSDRRQRGPRGRDRNSESPRRSDPGSYSRGR